ncbi:MAG TPA: Fur family transcriptional regulator [Anaeromyxobacter sp.]
MRQGRTDSESDAAGGRTHDALEKFEQFLAGKALRLTEARAAIVEAALARSGHYPIEELIADLKRLGIRGSKATVYRTLPLLTEAGIVRPAIVAGDSKSYETTWGAEHHDHLVCGRCRKVVEFGFEAFEILQREVAGRYGFRLDHHHHELVGTCPECLAKEGGKAETPPAGSGGAAGG